MRQKFHLVDEDDAGRLLLGLLEQVANLGGAATDEHLDKLRTGDAEERDARLAGDSLGKQRLTGARRAYKQGTAGKLGANLLIALGVLEKVDNLLQGLFGLFLAGDILEGDADIFGRDDARAGLAQASAHAAKAAATKVHRRVVIAHSLLHTAVEPPACKEEDSDGQHHRKQDIGHIAGVLVRNIDRGVRPGFADEGPDAITHPVPVRYAISFSPSS